jgi:seryl-tRNA synthetase
MSNLIKTIDNLFPENLELASRHSFFQLQYFLIGKEPTNQSKMWQCLRELNARKENLENIALQIEEENDNIDLENLNLLELEQKEKQEISELDKKRIQITKNKINRKINSLSKNIKSLSKKTKDIEEECEFFIQTFNSIKEKEPLKHFDDLEAQKNYWGTKLLEKINLKLILNSNIDTDLVETILALPDDIPIKKFMLNKINSLSNNVKKIN